MQQIRVFEKVEKGIERKYGNNHAELIRSYFPSKNSFCDRWQKKKGRSRRKKRVERDNENVSRIPRLCSQNAGNIIASVTNVSCRLHKIACTQSNSTRNVSAVHAELHVYTSFNIWCHSFKAFAYQMQLSYGALHSTDLSSRVTNANNCINKYDKPRVYRLC